MPIARLELVKHFGGFLTDNYYMHKSKNLYYKYNLIQRKNLLQR